MIALLAVTTILYADEDESRPRENMENEIAQGQIETVKTAEKTSLQVLLPGGY